MCSLQCNCPGQDRSLSRHVCLSSWDRREEEAGDRRHGAPLPCSSGSSLCVRTGNWALSTAKSTFGRWRRDSLDVVLGTGFPLNWRSNGLSLFVYRGQVAGSFGWESRNELIRGPERNFSKRLRNSRNAKEYATSRYVKGKWKSKHKMLVEFLCVCGH